MSTTTETEYLDEDAPRNGSAAPVESGSAQDQQDQQVNGHTDNGRTKEHTHVYVREDGTVSPMCLGGGCPTRVLKP